MKKLLAFLVMLFSVLYVSAYDFWVENDDGVPIYYNILEDGNSVEVTYRYSSGEYSEVVTIPSTVSYKGKEYNVTSIGYRTFLNCIRLTKIIIPENVTSIGEQAFSGCTGLTTITLPKNVTLIGCSAFRDCMGLTTITIPQSVASMGESAFSGCTSLTSITIPKNVTLIGGSAFRDCTGLTTITIPENVTSMGEFAFYGCTGLTEMTYNAIKCNYLNDNGLFGMFNTTLKKVIIGEKVEVIPNKIFYGCKGLTDIVIPQNVTSIGSEAFSGCTGLTTITIPQNVTSIGNEAFLGCTGLTTITIPPKVTSIESSVFSRCTGLTDITIPQNVNSIGSGAFSGCTGLTTITIPQNVSSIGSGAFSGCTGLTTITIPQNVISIGGYAFSECTGLTTITIPQNVNSIGGYAFSGCIGLTELIYNAINCNYLDRGLFGESNTSLEVVTIGKKVKCIPNNIFHGCKRLTTITIPQNVNSIGSSAFSNCTGLTTIIIPQNVNSIEYSVFSGCTGLKNIIIPQNVTSIGIEAFSGCTALKAITIPENVTSIGYSVFAGCTGLKELTYNAINCNYLDDYLGFKGLFGESNTTLEKLTIGKKVEVIPTKIFYGCKGLTTLTIPQNVTSFGGKAFAGCTGLTSITIPQNVTSIGYEVFAGCTRLKELTYNAINCNSGSSNWFGESNTTLEKLTIGENVVSIPAGIFSGCTGLKELTYNAINCTNFNNNSWTSLEKVTIGEKVESLPNSIFSGCTKLTTITIPKKVISIGSSAFSRCTGLTDITIPPSITSIKSSTFSNCTNLSSIIIPGSVTSIESSAFSGCTSLAAFTIPENVTSISSNLFSNCISLVSITIPQNITSIGNYSFSGCTELTSITIPQNVTSIASKAFSGCTSLTSITIPESVYRIQSNAFANCSNLTEIIYNAQYCDVASDWLGDTKNVLTQITIGEKVQTLPEFIFSGCNNLSELTFLGNSLTAISNSAFSSCNGLTSLALPEGVTSIGSNSFANCSGLTSLTIPESMESIGNYAFYACEGLKNIYCRMQTPSTNSTIFDEVNKANCRLHVPAGTYEAYSLAEAWKDFILKEEYKASATIAAGEGTVLINGKEITSLYIPEEGQSVTFTILPATGFHIDKVILNGEDVTTALTENVLTVEQVKEDQVLTVTFTESFSITAAFDAEKGTVLINGEDTVSANILEGNPVTFTITSKTGYQLSGILLNGEDVTSWLSNNTLTIENVRENILLEVTFSEKLFTINSTFDTTKGIVFINEEEKTSAQIQEGKTAVITVSPKVGYQLDKVFLNETDVTSSLINNTLTITDIRENQSIEIRFNEKLFEVKAIFDPERGSVLINHEETAMTTIQEGKPATFTITSSFGYRIEKIRLNEKDITESLTDNVVTIDSVMGNQALEVVFTEKLFEVINTFNAEQGTVLVNNTDTTMITIQEGSPVSFTIIPKVGYQLSQLLLNQKDITSSVIDGTFVIESIVENQTLETLFKEKLSLVATTFNATQGNVLINGENINSVNIQEGREVTFTILPAMGYKVEKVLLNEEDVTSLLADNTLTVKSIIGNQFLKVMFNMQLFNVTTTFNEEGGSVLINGKAADIFALQEGDIAEFTITPNEDYFIEKVLFNGEDVTNELVNGTLLIKTIMEDSSLEVTFQSKNYVSTAQTDSDPIRIYAKDGAIHINSSERIMKVMISNSAGMLIFASDILGEETVSLPAGIYFVKIGNKVTKVGVK